MKKILIMLLSLLVLCSVLLLASCGDGENPPAEASYTVELSPINGKDLCGAVVEFVDEAGAFLDYKELTSENKVTSKPLSGKVFAKITDLPLGYVVENSTIELTAESTKVEVKTEIIEDYDSLPTELCVGDVMYDMTFTDLDGNSYTLSEVLENKKMVLLNFWYSTCQPCKNEFPALNSVYLANKENALVLGLNTTDNSFSSFKDTFDPALSIPLCKADLEVESLFAEGYSGNWGAPATIVIDRNGIVAYMHVGPMTETEFEALFAEYLADEYTY
ncbi:MAG: TlpA family protein disulfide reductase [Clostridia bacterium]|nr:TlpA family protein disulfide reductase [Clostridia bacterium]